MARILLRSMALLSLAGLTGCVMLRGHYDRPIDIEKVQQIEIGVTTKAEVLALLGPPTEIESRDIVNVQGLIDDTSVNRLVSPRFFRYRYGRANGAALILVLFNYIDADVKFDTAMVFFDENDVVEYVSWVEDTRELPRYGPLSR